MLHDAIAPCQKNDEDNVHSVVDIIDRKTNPIKSRGATEPLINIASAAKQQLTRPSVLEKRTTLEKGNAVFICGEDTRLRGIDLFASQQKDSC